MFPMNPAEFEAEVSRVVEGLPEKLARQIRNVGFAVEDGRENLDLLGLYQGVDLTRRGEFYSGALPDLITVYRLPILLRCTTREEVLEQIEITVKHEIGHYFGIDDDRLHELGFG